MSEKTETGIFNNPSKRFWAGFFAMLCLVPVLVHALNVAAATTPHILEAIQFIAGTWLVALGGGDAVVRATREWRRPSIDKEPKSAD